jgi:AcrR family transcriptional regulator
MLAETTVEIVARVDARAAILDSAEAAFAEFGFGGASLRAIAREAGVNQAMVGYYFGSKEGLLQEVIRRRADHINDRRKELLQEILGRGQPRLDDLMDAFIRPAMELARDRARGGYSYVKLIALLGSSTDELSLRVVRECFDWIARRYIDAIRLAEPGLTESAATRGYLLSISVAMTASVMERRATGVAGELGYDQADTAELVRTAVAYATAGIRALARPPSNQNQLQGG